MPFQVCGIDGRKWVRDVQGTDAPSPTASAAASVIRDESTVCELSNVSCGFAGKSGSFRLPQHHDGVNINFLTSGVRVAMRFLRVIYPEKVLRVESDDFLVRPRC